MNLQDIRRVLQKNKIVCLKNQAQKIVSKGTSNKLPLNISNKHKQIEDFILKDSFRKEFDNLKRIGKPDMPVKLNKITNINIEENDNVECNYGRKQDEEKKLSQKKKIKVLTKKFYSNEEEIDSEEQDSKNSEVDPFKNQLKEHISSMKQSKKIITSGLSPKLIQDLSKYTRNHELQNNSQSKDLRLTQVTKKPNRLLLLDNIPSNQSNMILNNVHLMEKDFKNNFDNRYNASLPSSCGTDISTKLPKIIEKLRNKYCPAPPNPGSILSNESLTNRKNLVPLNYNNYNSAYMKSINDKKTVHYIFDTNLNNDNPSLQNHLNKQFTNNPDVINNVKLSKSKKSGCGCFSFC
jgi:hypothetical protein